MSSGTLLRLAKDLRQGERQKQGWLSQSGYKGSILSNLGQKPLWLCLSHRWSEQSSLSQVPPSNMRTPSFAIAESPRSPKSHISSIQEPPTPSIGTICRYDVTTGTTSGMYIIVDFFGGSRNCFCNFWFIWRDTVRVLNNLEYMDRWPKLCWRTWSWVWVEL